MNYRNRRTVRAYTDQAVSESALETILEAAARASNTGNMQTYSIILTTSAERKAQLGPLHFGQPMVEQAPVVLTFCADFRRFTQWCEASGEEVAYDNFMSLYTATIDAMLAAQNAAVAAEDLGLGICFLGTTLYNMPGIIELLRLPKGVVPVTTVTIGHPKSLPELTERLPLSAIVHREEYKERSPEEVRALYAETEALERNQQFVRDNGKETLAQVFCQVRYSPESYATLSKAIIETLRTQGFAL